VEGIVRAALEQARAVGLPLSDLTSEPIETHTDSLVRPRSPAVAVNAPAVSR
jgi:hypothetical protein